MNIKSQENKSYFFKKIKKQKKVYIFVHDERGERNKFRILKVIKGKKEEQKFLKDHYIVESDAFAKDIP